MSTGPDDVIARHEATVLVHFSHFVLFDTGGHWSATALHDDPRDPDQIAHAGNGGALLFTDDSSLDAHVRLDLRATPPTPPDIPPRATTYTGTFTSDTGQVILGAVTGSPSDTTIPLPGPGRYGLHAVRHPDRTRNDTGDDDALEHWTLTVWPIP